MLRLRHLYFFKYDKSKTNYVARQSFQIVDECGLILCCDTMSDPRGSTIFLIKFLLFRILENKVQIAQESMKSLIFFFQFEILASKAAEKQRK